MNKPHVFISFKTQERDTAHRLMRALTSAGYAVWWQENIQCGQEWHGEIDRAIAQAGAIVVLWSKAALASPWVRHEASQAIAKNIYAPVRIEPLEITSPYDRIQATDIMSWSEDVNHPGFQNLLRRLNELMPPPVPIYTQLRRFLWSQRSAIIVLAISGSALALLLSQRNSMKMQADQQNALIQQQQTLLANISRSIQPIKDFSCDVTLEFDSSQPEVFDYIARLRKSVHQVNGVFTMRGGEIVDYDANGPTDVLIERTSPLWPSKDKDPFLNALWNKIYISLIFTRNNVGFSVLKTNPYLNVYFMSDGLGRSNEYYDGYQEPYLRANFSSLDSKENPPIHWDVEQNKLYISFSVDVSSKQWDGNGKIVSIPDLESSFVSIGNMSYSVRNDDDFFKAIECMDIVAFRIKASGKEYNFNTVNMRKEPNCYTAKFTEAEGYFNLYKPLVLKDAVTSAD